MKPQDLIVECDGAGNMGDIDAWLANNGGGMAEDDCDPNLTWSSDLTGTNGDCGDSTELELSLIHI